MNQNRCHLLRQKRTPPEDAGVPTVSLPLFQLPLLPALIAGLPESQPVLAFAQAALAPDAGLVPTLLNEAHMESSTWPPAENLWRPLPLPASCSALRLLPWSSQPEFSCHCVSQLEDQASTLVPTPRSFLANSPSPDST